MLVVASGPFAMMVAMLGRRSVSVRPPKWSAVWSVARSESTPPGSLTMTSPGRSLEVVWKWLEVVWKWFGSGLEVVWK